jgi:hypothetical protein
MSGLYDDMVNELREEMEDEVRKEGEFTVSEFYDSLDQNAKDTLSVQAVRCRFHRKVELGEMTKRKVNLDGSSTNLFLMVEKKKAPEGASSDE